jgi:ADP-ribose pyrophosphatase
MDKKYGFQGKRVKVRLDQVRLQSGKEMTYEIVEVTDAVAILAILPDNKVVILRNNRPPAGKELYELPAGKIDPGEDAATAAKRELQEETGYLAERLEFVGALYTSPGITTEKIHCFIATGLTKGEQKLEEAEQGIEVYELGLAEANTYLDTGDIEDMKTAYLLRTALVLAAMKLK